MLLAGQKVPQRRPANLSLAVALLLSLGIAAWISMLVLSGASPKGFKDEVLEND